MTSATLEWWWPVTQDFGLIRSGLETVAAMRSRQYENAGLHIMSTPLQGSLHDCLSRLEPLSPAATKELYLGSTFGWTAYFANGCRGSDPSLLMFQLSKALGITALRARRSPDSARYPAVILEVYDTPAAGGDSYGYRRSIAAANDGGRWTFHQSGAPFAFEQIARYEARRKRDRFTPEMLGFYVEQMGIPALSDEVLQPSGTCQAWLISRPDHTHLPRYTLAEAKAL